jgi:hypothetical protein
MRAQTLLSTANLCCHVTINDKKNSSEPDRGMITKELRHGAAVAPVVQEARGENIH